MIHKIKSYFFYLLKSKGKHSIHAGFLYNLYTNHILKPQNKDFFDDIEKLRLLLLNNHSNLIYNDKGAYKHANYTVKVSHLAKKSVSKAKYSYLQYQLIAYFKPKTILEIGTSLGINTLYFAKAAPESNIFTLEGAAPVAKIAKNIFSNSPNIQLIEGNFDDILQPLVDTLTSIDYVFIDGNHTFDATIKYFEILLPKLNQNSIVVIDDIYWSVAMTKAWYTILKRKDVIISLDFYKLGILFFSKKQSKQDFVLKY